jgi:hypothetical protein
MTSTTTSTTQPGAVVLRPGRTGALLVLAAVGLVEVGLVAGVLIALSGRPGPGVLGLGSGWVVLGLLALAFAAVLLALVPRLLPPTTTLGPGGVTTRRWGRPHQVDLAALARVRYLPAATPRRPRVRAGATVAGTDPWHQRLELHGGGRTVVVDDRARWPEAVAVVADWVRRRPELVADSGTAAYLRDVGPLPAAPPPPRWPWGMLRLARREGDAWAPFLPDAHGRHSGMLDGGWAFGRATERGSRTGLALRWLVVVLWCSPVVVLPLLVAWLVLLVA